MVSNEIINMPFVLSTYYISPIYLLYKIKKSQYVSSKIKKIEYDILLLIYSTIKHVYLQILLNWLLLWQSGLSMEYNSLESDIIVLSSNKLKILFSLLSPNTIYLPNTFYTLIFLLWCNKYW